MQWYTVFLTPDVRGGRHCYHQMLLDILATYMRKKVKVKETPAGPSSRAFNKQFLSPDNNSRSSVAANTVGYDMYMQERYEHEMDVVELECQKDLYAMEKKRTRRAKLQMDAMKAAHVFGLTSNK